MRTAAALLAALAALAPAVAPSLAARAQDRADLLATPTQFAVGALLEENALVGDRSLVRLPVQWSAGSGRPRTMLIEFEPALGWHTTGGVRDASGISYTRVRLYRYFGSGRLTVGPDLEAYLKTETDTALGYGYDRLMPGVQASLVLPRGWRTALRARYEWSAAENPGVAPVARVVFRPTIYPPAPARWSFWGRGDVALDVHGKPAQYNVEALAAVQPDAARRLTLFVEPRLYVGAASRTRSLWRLRSGFTWSLGESAAHHPEGG